MCRAASSGSAPNARTPMIGSSSGQRQVGGGREVDGHAARASRAPSDAATAPVRSRSSAAPSAWLPGRLEPIRASSRVTSPPSSSMSDHHAVTFGAQRRGQRGHLLVVHHVAAEQHDAAKSLADLAAQPVRRCGGPSEAGQQDAGREFPHMCRHPAHPLHGAGGDAGHQVSLHDQEEDQHRDGETWRTRPSNHPSRCRTPSGTWPATPAACSASCPAGTRRHRGTRSTR